MHKITPADTIPLIRFYLPHLYLTTGPRIILIAEILEGRWILSAIITVNYPWWLVKTEFYRELVKVRLLILLTIVRLKDRSLIRGRGSTKWQNRGSEPYFWRSPSRQGYTFRSPPPLYFCERVETFFAPLQYGSNLKY